MVINVRVLSKELQNKSEKELNENPKNLEADIYYIRSWIEKQCHLNVNPDDQFILTFLRGCKFNYRATKQKIDTFYSTRTLIPEYFGNRDPLSSEIQRALSTGRFWVPLPKSSDPLAPRLFCDFGQLLEPSERFNPVASLKTTLMVIDILLDQDDSFAINGYCVLQYLTGFSAKSLTQISLKMLQNSYTCIIKRYPTRLKGFHFVNVPPVAYTMYNIIKPFVSQKIQSRVTFHQGDDFNKIHKMFPKAELPIELGGESYSIRTIQDEWKTKIEKHREWLIKGDSIRSDESRRIGKVSFDPDVLDKEGSFRQLEVD